LLQLLVSGVVCSAGVQTLIDLILVLDLLVCIVRLYIPSIKTEQGELCTYCRSPYKYVVFHTGITNCISSLPSTQISGMLLGSGTPLCPYLQKSAGVPSHTPLLNIIDQCHVKFPSRFSIVSQFSTESYLAEKTGHNEHGFFLIKIDEAISPAACGCRAHST
jgi:hypothetical protein